MYEVSIKTHFAAAHNLTGYDGACSIKHGHNWEVEVFVVGQKLNSIGILVDFKIVKERVRSVLGEFDQVDLNPPSCFAALNPTSENLARIIYDRLEAVLNGPDYKVSRVSVKETPESTATYSR
jgi:6-pyruvoyltetrahydropterin/6-carboxytetrahydropterin synthase